MISSLGAVIGYAGYISDASATLSLARFRWLNSEYGRWISRDPLGAIDGANQFQYVSSAPYAYVDPFGLAGIGTKPHPVPLYLGGSPDQLCLDLIEFDDGEGMHKKQHDYIKRKLGGGNWESQREFWKSLTEEQQKKIIRDSLKEMGLEKEYWKDSSIDDYFRDHQPGVNRSGKRKWIKNIRCAKTGKMIRGVRGAAPVICLLGGATAARSEAARVMNSGPCKQLQLELDNAFKDGCEVDCLALQRAASNAQPCADALLAFFAENGLKYPGLVFWEKFPAEMEKLVKECHASKCD